MSKFCQKISVDQIDRQSHSPVVDAAAEAVRTQDLATLKYKGVPLPENDVQIVQEQALGIVQNTPPVENDQPVQEQAL